MTFFSGSAKKYLDLKLVIICHETWLKSTTMLSSLVKEHQAKQAARKDERGIHAHDINRLLKNFYVSNLFFLSHFRGIEEAGTCSCWKFD